MSIGALKRTDITKTIFLGELSLDGRINHIDGILPMCLEAKKSGIEKVIIPKSNENEALLVDGLEIIGLDNLKQVIEYLNGNLQVISKPKKSFSIQTNYDIDFSEVKGQVMTKRALEISASGGHNCLLIGTPGTGKTMMINRLQTILPELNLEETIEITKLHSVGGILKDSIATKRPFRVPHHSITKTALLGGGRNPKPGEISLAHLGVLFLDELLEFKKDVLESLRVPLECKKIDISRVGYTATYPCNFILVASMNPCPCGYYGSNTKKCTCTESQRKNYMAKLSGPLLDRFDMQIYVPQIKYNDSKNNESESSKEIRLRVNKARDIQKERYKEEKIFSNSELTPKLIDKYCELEEDSKKILNMTCERLSLSTRAYYKILKISRTIADMDNSKKIKNTHVLEAIQYRKKEKDGL